MDAPVGPKAKAPTLVPGGLTSSDGVLPSVRVRYSPGTVESCGAR